MFLKIWKFLINIHSWMSLVCGARVWTSARQKLFLCKTINEEVGGAESIEFSNFFFISHFLLKLIDWWNRVLLSHWHSSHRGFENFKVLIRSLRSSIYQSYFANIVRARYKRVDRPAIVQINTHWQYWKDIFREQI